MTVLERVREAMEHHAVFEARAVSSVRPSDLAKLIAVVEAAKNYAPIGNDATVRRCAAFRELENSLSELDKP